MTDTPTYTDTAALAQVVASILTEQGYVMHWTTRGPSVYRLADAPERVQLDALTDTVRPLVLELLADAAGDDRLAPADRQSAEDTARFIAENGNGSTSYVRSVVDYTRDWLPEVDKATVAPPRDRRDYMRTYHEAQRRSRAAAQAEAEVLARQMLPQMLESGEYEVGSVWDAWCGYLNTDYEVLETYPELAHLGKKRFYAILTTLDGVTVRWLRGRRYVRIP